MIPIPIASPDGTAKRATDFRNRSGSPRAGARRQREHEGGNADRDRGGDRELAR